jgi:hypothetical protein
VQAKNAAGNATKATTKDAAMKSTGPRQAN